MTDSPARPAPGLYIVATPIGALRDITLRALDILGSVDRIACEDTRVTGKLLAYYGIKTPMTSYHEHNAARQRPKLLARLARGERLALVSDAGTPLISDPGYKLVAEARAAGLPVFPVPGPAAFVAAAMAAGLPTDRLVFLGFPPTKAAARQRGFEPFVRLPATLILYESARRLGATLADLVAVLGDREAAVCRELTKRYEEVRRDRLSALAGHYADVPPKGEIVIVVAPPEDGAPAPEAVEAALETALEHLSVKDAAAVVARSTGGKRRDLYARALEIKGRRPERKG